MSDQNLTFAPFTPPAEAAPDTPKPRRGRRPSTSNGRRKRKPASLELGVNPVPAREPETTSIAPIPTYTGEVNLLIGLARRLNELPTEQRQRLLNALMDLYA